MQENQYDMTNPVNLLNNLYSSTLLPQVMTTKELLTKQLEVEKMMQQVKDQEKPNINNMFWIENENHASTLQH